MPEKYLETKNTKYLSIAMNTTNYNHQNCKKEDQKIVKKHCLFFNNISIVPVKISPKDHMTKKSYSLC